jgi:glycosyltransferase involved in cell wall biosynthesis
MPHPSWTDRTERVQHVETHLGDVRQTSRHVVVLNQYALPRERGGGTRHVDLFGRLQHWRPLIVAAGRDHYSQERFRTADRRFRLLWVPGYRGNGLSRVVGWAIYAIQAAILGLSRRQLDLVYASTPSMLAPVAGWIVARVRRVPLVVEVRDLWPESLVAAGALRAGGLLHRILMRWERWMMRTANRIVAVTPGWEEHFASVGIASQKVIVVPNGAESSDFGDASVKRRGKPDGARLTAVFAGAHGEKDGLVHILNAAAELPDLDFLLVGSGPAKERAAARARRDKLANVSFLPPVPKAELGKLLASCDIGIHAVTPLPVFLKGMSPNKLFDYMAAGLPVVSNMEVGLREVIRDGECGRLGGPDELASCLRAVADAGATQRVRWGRTAQLIVDERFSRSAAAVRLQSLLDELADSELIGGTDG